MKTISAGKPSRMAAETKTCKNCKFGSYLPPSWLLLQDQLRVRHLNCECPKLVYEGPREADNLVYWDASSYRAGFSVGPDFGCVHFVPFAWRTWLRVRKRPIRKEEV